MGTVTMDMLNVLPREVPAMSTPKKSKSLDNSPVLIVNDADSTLDSIFPEPDFDMKENDSDSDSMCDENDLVHCKNRLDVKSTKGTSVARRNERERNRVKHINRTFTLLRQHLPAKKANKKLSKVETLRSAVQYISQLQKMIDDHDAMAASAFNFEQAYLAQNQPQFTLPRQRIPNHHLQHQHHHLHPMIQHHIPMHPQPQQPMYSLMDPLTNVGALTTPASPVTRVRAPSVSSSVYSAPSPVSPTNSVFSANSPTYSSDSSWEALGQEEADDLADFTRKAIIEITEMGGW